MAITWDVEITNVNIITERASVTATRTDDAVTDPPRKYSFDQTPIGTAADRISLLNTIKQKDEDAVTQKTNIDNLVSGWEQTAKADLETWETIR